MCVCVYWMCGAVGSEYQDPRPSGVLCTHSTRALSVRININTYSIVSPPLKPYKHELILFSTTGRYK